MLSFISVTVTPLNPFILSTGPSTSSLMGTTNHNILANKKPKSAGKRNNLQVISYLKIHIRASRRIFQMFQSNFSPFQENPNAPMDGQCAVCRVVPYQFHHFGAFVCNRCRAFFSKLTISEGRNFIQIVKWKLQRVDNICNYVQVSFSYWTANKIDLLL